MLHKSNTDSEKEKDLSFVDITDVLSLKTVGKLHKILINHWRFSTLTLELFILLCVIAIILFSY